MARYRVLLPLYEDKPIRGREGGTESGGKEKCDRQFFPLAKKGRGEDLIGKKSMAGEEEKNATFLLEGKSNREARFSRSKNRMVMEKR